MINKALSKTAPRKRLALTLALLLQLCWQAVPAAAQDLFVNMSLLDGLGVTPDNLMNFQVQSNLPKTTHALVTGTIRYRNSDLLVSYKMEYDLRPGVNVLQGSQPKMSYSSPALRELFEQYRMLPQGIYEYCVTITPDYNAGEILPGINVQECVYHKSEDIFLIDLVDPDNNAKIREYHPMLSWVVNYPFASQLQYRLRIAEVKQGQNNTAAITRNNPVYDERNLMQLSQVYPVYAKPLQKDQPYAWTVDAYYKGILLGGAQPWRFTIIEDSLLTAVSKDPSYVDIKKESGFFNMYAPGLLKLKYDLTELRTDSLQLTLLDANGKTVKMKEPSLKAQYGDNRFIINFYETMPLKHLQSYTLVIASQSGRTYRLLFKYVNPELIK